MTENDGTIDDDWAVRKVARELEPLRRSIENSKGGWKMTRELEPRELKH